MHALEELQAEFDTELLFVESGGDNLAANYSRELADYIIYVVRCRHGARPRTAPSERNNGSADFRLTSRVATRFLVRADLVSPSRTCSLSTR